MQMHILILDILNSLFFLIPQGIYIFL